MSFPLAMQARETVNEEDLKKAIQLVILPRAEIQDQQDQSDEQPPPPPPPPQDQQEEQENEEEDDDDDDDQEQEDQEEQEDQVHTHCPQTLTEVVLVLRICH